MIPNNNQATIDTFTLGKDDPNRGLRRDSMLRNSTCAIAGYLIATFLAFQIGCTSAELSLSRELLKKGSPKERVSAATKLGDLNESGTIPPLVGALDDNEELVRKAVVAALKKKGPSAIAPLINVLRSGTINSRKHAVEVFESLGSSAFEPIVALFESDKNPDAQSAAILSLGAVEDDRAVPMLLSRVNDPNLSIRRSAITALGHFSSPEIFQTLFPLLEDKKVNDIAGKALGRSGESQIPRLADGIEGKPLDVQFALIDALGATKNMEAFPILKGLLRSLAMKEARSDPDWKLEGRIQKALIDIGPAVVEPLLEVLRAAKDDAWAMDGTITGVLSSVVNGSNISVINDELQTYRTSRSAGTCAAVLMRNSEKPEAEKLDNNIVPTAQAAISTALRSDSKEVRSAVAGLTPYIRSPWIDKEMAEALERRDYVIIEAGYRHYVQRAVAGSDEIIAEAILRPGGGSWMMAEDLVNCGNEKLEQAARSWARRNGYVAKKVERTGSASLLWGRK